jgi:arylsulfatase A-like enzyme
MSGVDFAGRIGRTIAESQPWWPPGPARAGRPNVLVVLFDDVGFADFGCYGSTLSTPTIDALASRGLRLSGFHTTAMCSTTRAALMTGCNHHRVGMGCLANFDSGFPGYRGKIAPEASTLAEMLRGAGYANYMVGKWHVTPLTENRPQRPLRRLAAGVAATTASTASWTPRPTSTRPSWCATTRPSPAPAATPAATT